MSKDGVNLEHSGPLICYDFRKNELTKARCGCGQECIPDVAASINTASLFARVFSHHAGGGRRPADKCALTWCHYIVSGGQRGAATHIPPVATSRWWACRWADHYWGRSVDDCSIVISTSYTNRPWDRDRSDPLVLPSDSPHKYHYLNEKYLLTSFLTTTLTQP